MIRFRSFYTIVTLFSVMSLLFSYPNYVHASAKAPLREIFTNVNSDIEWNGVTQEIIIKRNQNIIKFKVNSDVAVKNNSTIIMDAPITLDGKGNSLISTKFIYPLIKSNLNQLTFGVSHIVQPSDSLWTLSKQYNVTIDELMLWNHLKTDMIYDGSELQITPAQKYQVTASDTLQSISSKYNLTVSQLKASNNLSDEKLDVGQTLSIPIKRNSPVSQPATLSDSIFPLLDFTYQPYDNNYGDDRTYGGNRSHEGIDIIAEQETPIFSSTNGIVLEKGWNELGGWRLLIKANDTTAIYYAHLNRYVDGIKVGDNVGKGELIGYVGNTGYGPVGTSGKFVNHLHFGIYNISSSSKMLSINPYNHLKWWEFQ